MTCYTDICNVMICYVIYGKESKSEPNLVRLNETKKFEKKMFSFIKSSQKKTPKNHG